MVFDNKETGLTEGNEMMETNRMTKPMDSTVKGGDFDEDQAE